MTTERVEEGGRTHTSVMEEGGEGWAPGSTTPAKVWVGEERLLLPSIAEMPAPPVRGGDVDAAPAAPGDTTERTLRELFWGED